MEILIVRSWKALALRGVAAIALGLMVTLWPSIAMVSLVFLFGTYALVDGMLAMTAATHQRGRGHVWGLALEGIAGLGFGLSAFFWTGMTALVLVNMIAFWALVTGVIEIVLAIRLRREIPGEFLLGVAGISSLLLGAVMFIWPAASALSIVMLLGVYALFFGASMIALAFRLRHLAPTRALPSHPHPRAI